MEVVAGNKNIVAGAVVALDAASREHLVIVMKATWSIPLPRQRPRPLPPEALTQTDVYVAEPGQSAMLYGSDFARFKPRCDVLFNACAHSSNGEPVAKLPVGWRVGPLSKQLHAVGPRWWSRTFTGTALSAPEPFTRMPLHYGNAFGGTRVRIEGRGDARQLVQETLPSNPAGIGFAATGTPDIIDGVAAPVLEAIDAPFRRPTDAHAPLAFSAIGRHWPPRKDYAGTCDDDWRKNVFPLLPDDFDERFHQCAPEDQQMDYPRGGEEVILLNMMKGRPDVRFHLPMLESSPVRVLRKDYSVETRDAVVDTLYFEPDQERFSVVWRTSLPIRRRAQEFEAIAIGPVDPAWWAARSMGLDGTGCGDAARKTQPWWREAAMVFERDTAHAQPGSQRRFQPLRVAGRGMCCAVGHRAPAATAAINARINHFRETEFIDGEGAPIVGAALHAVDSWGEERLDAMLRSVISEALESVPQVPFECIAVVVLSAESQRPGTAYEGLLRVLDALSAGRVPRQGLFHAHSRHFACGKGGIAHALEEVSVMLAQRDGPGYVVLAAVDSYLDAAAIEHHLESERLATPSNPDGFIPAEGASALLLSHRPEGREASLWIDGFATHDDPWRPGSEEPQRAQALTRAIREAAQEAGVDVSALAFHASGMTGESWSSKEINLALSRALERRVAEFPHCIIASHVGETGAAAPVLTLAWLADAMARADGPGHSALLHFSGDDGRRAALVVRFRPPRAG